jgi:natural resistance-associated macrophage protein
MPHNLYLHSSLVLSRKFDTTKKGLVREANAYNAIESAGSLFISFMINFSVIGTFAYFSMLDTTYNLNLENAATALELTFGDAAKYIWAVGLLASGQSSTMTGTYAGQFVMEGFLDMKIAVWKRVTITRLVSILPALSVCFIQNFD